MKNCRVTLTMICLLAFVACTKQSPKIELQIKLPQKVTAQNATQVLGFYIINVHGIPGLKGPKVYSENFRDQNEEFFADNGTSAGVAADPIDGKTITITSAELAGATDLTVQILAVYTDLTTFGEVFYYDDEQLVLPKQNIANLQLTEVGASAGELVFGGRLMTSANGRPTAKLIGSISPPSQIPNIPAMDVIFEKEMFNGWFSLFYLNGDARLTYRRADTGEVVFPAMNAAEVKAKYAVGNSGNFLLMNHPLVYHRYGNEPKLPTEYLMGYFSDDATIVTNQKACFINRAESIGELFLDADKTQPLIYNRNVVDTSKAYVAGGTAADYDDVLLDTQQACHLATNPLVFRHQQLGRGDSNALGFRGPFQQLGMFDRADEFTRSYTSVTGMLNDEYRNTIEWKYLPGVETAVSGVEIYGYNAGHTSSSHIDGGHDGLNCKEQIEILDQQLADPQNGGAVTGGATAPSTDGTTSVLTKLGEVLTTVASRETFTHEFTSSASVSGSNSPTSPVTSASTHPTLTASATMPPAPSIPVSNSWRYFLCPFTETDSGRIYHNTFIQNHCRKDGGCGESNHHFGWGVKDVTIASPSTFEAPNFVGSGPPLRIIGVQNKDGRDYNTIQTLKPVDHISPGDELLIEVVAGSVFVAPQVDPCNGKNPGDFHFARVIGTESPTSGPKNIHVVSSSWFSGFIDDFTHIDSSTGNYFYFNPSGPEFCFMKATKVPHYLNLTVDADLTSAPLQFDTDGNSDPGGGTMAFRVAQNLTLNNAAVDASGSGFPGGFTDNSYGAGIHGWVGNSNGGAPSSDSIGAGGGAGYGDGGLGEDQYTPAAVGQRNFNFDHIRLVYGGGGGVGSSAAGAPGGGNIFVAAKTLTASGNSSFTANGSNNSPSDDSFAQDPGPGGGGSINLIIDQLLEIGGTLTVSAKGGNAENQGADKLAGGGGGGFINLSVCDTFTAPASLPLENLGGTATDGDPDADASDGQAGNLIEVGMGEEDGDTDTDDRTFRPYFCNY